MFISGICKALTKKSKEKDCEIIERWIKTCRHFHWSVTSTEEGQNEAILATFQAFLTHIINKTQTCQIKFLTSVPMRISATTHLHLVHSC